MITTDFTDNSCTIIKVSAFHSNYNLCAVLNSYTNNCIQIIDEPTSTDSAL